MSLVLFEVLKQIIAFVVPLALGSAGSVLWARRKVMKKQEDMLLALGQYRLMRNTERYLLRGHISIEELTVLENIFNAYRALGGNGVIAELYHKCQGLEVKRKDDIL